MTARLNIEWNGERMAGPPGSRSYVPEHLQGALRRYVEQGVEPGDGLRPILEDRRLSEVLAHVDDDVARCLHPIYRFLYNNLGSPAWGSPEKVAAWIERGGIEGKP